MLKTSVVETVVRCSLDLSNSVHGLRLYKDVNASVGAATDLNFYSRRSGGPYYRWHYEKVGGWQWSRMRAPELAHRELIIAPWKGAPATLKLSLTEHYME